MSGMPARANIISLYQKHKIRNSKIEPLLLASVFLIH